MTPKEANLVFVQVRDSLCRFSMDEALRRAIVHFLTDGVPRPGYEPQTPEERWQQREAETLTKIDAARPENIAHPPLLPFAHCTEDPCQYCLSESLEEDRLDCNIEQIERYLATQE